MPDTCSAVGCKNRRQKKREIEDGHELHFYRIPWGSTPQKIEKRRLWMMAICREKLPEHARICSAHFISGQASDDPKDPDYVPSLFAYNGNAHSRPHSLSEKCCVPNCRNDSRYNCNKSLSFHPFPKGADLRSRWIEKIVDKFGRDLHVTKNTRICSKHFRKTDMILNDTGPKKVKSRVVPSKFQLSKKVPKRVASEHDCDRGYSRFGENNEKLLDIQSRSDEKPGFTEVLAQDFTGPTTSEQEPDEMPTPCSKGDHMYAGLPTDVVNQLRFAKDRIRILESQCKRLVNKLFFLERFSNDSESIKFYTGFADYATLKAVFLAFEPTGRNNITRWSEVQKYCGRSMGSVGEEIESTAFPLIDEFFMFMCYVRQGFCEQDLAIRFNVPTESVTYILLTWINYLFVSLRKFQIWPSRKSIDDNMPECFKNTYPNTRVILDCSEVTVQMPGPSSHSHPSPDVNITYKGLLGVSPFGAVTFVSDLYVGCISDCQIAESSRVLNLMVEPCTVLAPESFAIQEPAHPQKSTIVVPPFWSSCRGTCYETDEMMDLRFHIETALSHVKDYRVFQSVIPRSLAESANQMWMVCALLANFKRSLCILP